MVRELEKQGMTFSRSPVPEKPKRVTQKRLELLSKIKRQTLREYAVYTNKWETPIEIYTKRHGIPDIKVRKGKRKGRKLGSINKNPRLVEKKRKAPKEKKARQPRPPKPPVEPTPEEPPVEEQLPVVAPEEPVFESDIIISNIESILAGTTNFKGLAEYLIQLLHEIVNDLGKDAVANNIKNAPINVLDTAVSISVEELRYRDRAVSNASLLIMALTGTNTTFDTLENIASKASEDSKDVPQYRPRGFGRGLKISKHERELQDRMDKELSNAQLRSEEHTSELQSQ